MTPEPLELLARDLSPGEALREHGMRQVTENADPVAVALVDKVIADLAASGQPFTANQARLRLATVHPPLIGARFAFAAKHGHIRKTGRYVKSTLRSTRAHVIAEWVGVS